MSKRRRLDAIASPCFEVSLNGRRLALAGVHGEGNLNVNLHWSRTSHYGEGAWASGAVGLWVGGGDFSDPVWDRFRRWVDRKLASGDRVEIAVLQGVQPDAGRPVSRSRRIPLDQWPSRKNPTVVKVPGAELFALTAGVLLRVGKRSQGSVQLTPRQAKRIGRGLVRAAEVVEARNLSRRSR